ncbi:peptidoglycan-binding protein [Streptomyces sp. NPDC003719]
MAERTVTLVGDDGTAPSAGRQLARRRRVLVTALVGAVAVSALGIGASQVIKSPAQAAADTAAPPPSVMTAPVEKRVLRNSVIVRGMVAASQSVDVTPSGSAEPGVGGAVITAVGVRAGESVRPGKVLLEVSGRPVIALRGALPVYRDLKPGVEGKDVAQLQQALGETGHSVGGDRKGYFGAGTKAALIGLYRSAGYDPLPADPDGEATLEGARDAVTEARRHLEDIQTAPGRPASGQSAVSDGGKGADEPEQTSPAHRSVETDRAREDLQQAQEDLAKAEAGNGPMLPASEVVYVQSFPARVSGVGAVVGHQASGSVMTISAGRLVVTGTLSRSQRGLVRPGQRVEILSELDGTTAQAEVRTVAATVGPEQNSGASDGGRQEDAAPGDGTAPGYAVTVTPDKPLADSMTGQDVRLTIRTAATKGEVLVVPVSAISAGADGATTVTVVEPDDTRRRVPVTAGASGDGYVEVRPVVGTTLAAGEKVVTGAASGPGGEG